jgi:short-subunit dehydrogenase
MPAALVTGASTGLGREFARICAREGYDVILVARSRPQLEALSAEIEATFKRRAVVFPQDLATPDAGRIVFDAVQQSGMPLEILINNAGFGLVGRFWELDGNKQIEMLQVNVLALTELTRLCLPGFIAQRKGRIMNIASTAAFQPGPLMAVYFATKAYVVSFSEAVHNEAREFGVSVTCVCPGPTKTEFADRAGMGNSRLFKGRRTMEARDVAEQGFSAMKSGRALLIPGRMNAAMAFMARMAPLQLAASVARRLQESA